MRVLIHGIGLLALGFLLAGPAFGQTAPAELKKLHVLMVFDTTDQELASSLKIDEWRVRRLLKMTIPEGRIAVSILKGKEVTPARILAYYRDLKVDATDGLLFFYGGHGATNPMKKHFLDLACGEELIREDLRKAMEAKKTALTLLLTDCCSTPRKTAQVTERRVDDAAKTEKLHPTVRCLLFQARGTVDVTAATDNASWSDNEKGGLFTRALCRMITTSIKSLDADRDGFVSWQEFFPQLQKETEIVFRGWSRELRARGEKIDGSTQKPHSFALGARVALSSRDCAVLSIENGTERVLVYRWRWTGNQEWNEASLASGEKKVHFVELTPAQQELPAMEAEIKKGRVTTLKASKWTGKGEPTVEDGERYRLGPRKK